MLAIAAVVAGGAIGLALRGDGGSGTGNDRAGAGSSTTKRSSGSSSSSRTAAAPASAPQQTAPPPVAAASANGDPLASNAQGFDRIKAGDYAGAVAPLQTAVKGFRDAGRTDELDYYFALYNLGVALNRSGRPAEAIPFLEERLQNPNQQGTVRKELEAAQQAAGVAPGKPGKAGKAGKKDKGD